MDPVGFQTALGEFKSFLGDSVEALVAACNDGPTEAIKIIVP